MPERGRGKRRRPRVKVDFQAVMDTVRVGLLGLGIVGSQVAERLECQRDLVTERTGGPVELTRVLVRDTAKRRAVDVYFEAAVGGGIPLISTFKIDLLANQISRIEAVINGTTNFIIDRMARDGAGFDEALAEAQRLGYAEADPTYDVEGWDAVFKLTIMSSIAFRGRIDPDEVHREGIRGLDPVDFRYARDMGYAIR